MVTIRDIAALSGYSVTTVSRALNDYSDVNSDTKAYIKKIAAKHGYSPNVLARSLVNKTSRTFGFITSNFSEASLMDNMTFKLFVNSLEAANNLGYDIVLIHYNNKDTEKKTFAQLMAERNLIGAIIQGFDKDDELCRQALTSKVPTVFIDNGLSNKNSAFVMSDIKKAVALGVTYLHDCGYENLWFVHGAKKAWITGEWLHAIETFLEISECSFKTVTLLDGHYTLEYAEQLAERLPIPETSLGILCASDLMGIGMMKGLQKRCVNIPDTIGILGYDDMAVSRYVTPSLSTIAQSPKKIGLIAVELLIERVNKPMCDTVLKNKIVDVDLIVRESTRR